jgi:hypothetical protein
MVMAKRGTRYEDLPGAERQLAESGGIGKPNSYVRAADDPPYYSPAVLEFLGENADLVLGSEKDDDGDSIEGARLPTNGSRARH